VVTVAGEAGAAITVSFFTGGKSVVKTLTGTGAAQPVVLTAGDVATLGNGGIGVSAIQTDQAGNAGTFATNSIVIDTVAPAAPALALGNGIWGGATQAEATQGSGVVTVAGEAGAAITVSFFTGGKSVVKTLTGTGAAQPVVLTAGDVATLGNGGIGISAIQTDQAGNAGTFATNSIVIDTVAPAAPVVSLVTAGGEVLNLAKATQPSGVVRVRGAAGSNLAITFFNGPRSVVKTMAASGVAQGVVLTDADVSALGSGGVGVSAIQTDTAGNTSPVGTNAFTVDALAPASPTVALGPGVAGGATQSEATQGSGVVTVAGEAGAALTVTFFTGPKTVVKRLAATGVPQPVTLTPGDVSTLGNGGIGVSAVQTDAAGNISSFGTQAFTIDTANPAQPTLVLGPGAASNALHAEGVAAVTAEPGAVVTVTVFSGPNSIVKTLTGTGGPQPIVLTAAEASTLGDGDAGISAIQVDQAGNSSAVGAIGFDIRIPDTTPTRTDPQLSLEKTLDFANTTVAQKLEEKLRNVAQGNERSAKVEKISVDRASGEVRGGFKVRHRQVSGKVFNLASGKHVPVVTYDLTQSGEFTFNIFTKELRGHLDLGRGVKVNLEDLRKLAEGDLTPLWTAAATLKQRSNYDGRVEAIRAKYGAANVLVASKAFVDWMGPETLLRWGTEAVLSSGASLSSIPNEVALKLRGETDFIRNWLLAKVKNATTAKSIAAKIVEALANRGNIEDPRFAIRWSKVDYWYESNLVAGIRSQRIEHGMYSIELKI
jgi:hypothetical protein